MRDCLTSGWFTFNDLNLNKVMKEAYDLSRKLFRVQKYFHPPTLILNFVVFSK